MTSADVDTFEYSRLNHKQINSGSLMDKDKNSDILMDKDRNSDSLMNKVARDMIWNLGHEIDSNCFIGSNDARGKERFRKKLEEHTRRALGESYKVFMRNDGSYFLKDANMP